MQRLMIIMQKLETFAHNIITRRKEITEYQTETRQDTRTHKVGRQNQNSRTLQQHKKLLRIRFRLLKLETVGS